MIKVTSKDFSYSFLNDTVLHIDNPTDKKAVRTNKRIQQNSRIQSTHKDQLHFYTLTMNNLKRQLQKQFHLQ